MGPAYVRVITFLCSGAISLGACSAIGEDGGVIGDPSGEDNIFLEVPGRNPVIIVHGCPPPPGTDTGDLALTTALRNYFLARGYGENEVIKFLNAGPVCDSTLTQAAQLADLVIEVSDETGKKVDLVAHSMGALTSRLVIASIPERIDDLVTVAGANHGTLIGSLGVAAQPVYGAPAYEGAKEMFIPYACQGQAVQAADVQFQLNGCLTLLGRSTQKDETPGSIDYLSIRNLLDEIIQPGNSACLNQKRQNDCSDQVVNKQVTVLAALCPDGTPCPAHAAMLWDPGVMQMVYNFTSAPD